jgi:hypothetical protein
MEKPDNALGSAGSGRMRVYWGVGEGDYGRNSDVGKIDGENNLWPRYALLLYAAGLIYWERHVPTTGTENPTARSTTKSEATALLKPWTVGSTSGIKAMEKSRTGLAYFSNHVSFEGSVLDALLSMMNEGKSSKSLPFISAEEGRIAKQEIGFMRQRASSREMHILCLKDRYSAQSDFVSETTRRIQRWHWQSIQMDKLMSHREANEANIISIVAVFFAPLSLVIVSWHPSPPSKFSLVGVRKTDTVSPWCPCKP